MTTTSSALLASLYTGFRGEFHRVYSETPSDFANIATVISSTTSSSTYGWLGQFPSLQEWVGNRVIKDMQAHSYSITNKLHESTLGIKRTAIEDDEVGIYRPLFGEMGRAAKVFPDELCFGLLKKGTQTACFDGQSFFDTEHPVYASTDGSGPVTLASNFDEGTGPAWYLLDNSRIIKSVIFQERTQPDLQAITASDDEAVFMRDEYRYGIRYRCNVGFAFWQLAYCSKKPLTDENFNAAYDAMAALKADGGRPLGVRPTHLIVPTYLRTAAHEVCVVGRRGNGADNPNAGIVTAVVTPWLN